MNNQMSYCFKRGVVCYPKYLTRHTTVKTSFGGQIKEWKLVEGKWYLEVNNNGNIIIYPEPIGNFKKLKGEDYYDQLKKVYQHWHKVLTNN